MNVARMQPPCTWYALPSIDASAWSRSSASGTGSLRGRLEPTDEPAGRERPTRVEAFFERTHRRQRGRRRAPRIDLRGWAGAQHDGAAEQLARLLRAGALDAHDDIAGAQVGDRLGARAAL